MLTDTARISHVFKCDAILISSNRNKKVLSQAVLINCLLRNYLNYNLYNQADKLVLKSTFPEQASNSEWAR